MVEDARADAGRGRGARVVTLVRPVDGEEVGGRAGDPDEVGHAVDLDPVVPLVRPPASGAVSIRRPVQSGIAATTSSMVGIRLDLLGARVAQRGVPTDPRYDASPGRWAPVPTGEVNPLVSRPRPRSIARTIGAVLIVVSVAGLVAGGFLLGQRFGGRFGAATTPPGPRPGRHPDPRPARRRRTVWS